MGDYTKPRAFDLGSPARVGTLVRFREITAAIAFVAGALTLVGLATGADVLTRWAPSSTSMNPITAAMLLLGGIALVLPPRWQLRGTTIIAIPLILAGGAKVTQLLLGQALGVDQMVAVALRRSGTALSDALAPNTAAALILLGIALLVGSADRAGRAIAAQSLSLIAIVIAIFALIGFALGAATINEFTLNRMAVNAAVGLIALGLGIMSLTPAHGLMRLLVHQSPAGKLARLALPICLMLPLLLGVGRLWIQKSGAISTGDGVVIMIAGNMLLSLALLWVSLILLLRIDADLRAKAAALAVSEAQYRQAGRIGKMGHWQYDVVHHRLHWTRELRALLGVDDDIAPDFAVMNELIHPDDRDGARAMMIRAQTLGEDWNWQLRLIGPEGEIRYAKSHGICHRAPDGSLASIFGVLADITELETARQGAEAATRAQAAFLANMSHEIRTPLNGVIGFINLLLESKLDKTQRRYLSLVSESAQSLLKLLNDILDLSKVQAGQLDVSPSATDLRQTVRHALKLMAPLAEQKSLKLKGKVEAAFPEAVMIDGARFRQILLNLLGNALKFTERGSVSVILGADRDADGLPVIRASVADSGIGIASDRLEAMFNPFVQADSSTSRKFGGSGLGLSISRQLAEQMGGTLGLEARPGGGTIATLVLPLLPVEAPVRQGHAAEAGAGGKSAIIAGLIGSARARPALSILLVEDLEINRELVGEMLRRLGHRVDFAEDGVDAVAKARRLRTEPTAWDLILMDVQMPRMNGTEATRRIRQQGGAASSIPIVALTANAFDSEIQESHAAGMNDHMVKPVGFEQLHDAVERWGRPQQGSIAAVG